MPQIIKQTGISHTAIGFLTALFYVCGAAGRLFWAQPSGFLTARAAAGRLAMIVWRIRADLSGLRLLTASARQAVSLWWRGFL